MKQSGIYLSDQFNAMKDRALRAEAELTDLRERYAHVNAEYEAMMAARDRLEAELAIANAECGLAEGRENYLLAELKKAEAELAKFREALILLLHHLPLRGEPVTAKEVAIKRARDVLARKGVSDGK